MKIHKAGRTGKVEKLVKLGTLKGGDVFRMQGTSFEEAFSGKDDACFYMVVEGAPKKDGRTTVCSLDGKQFLERDNLLLVTLHVAHISVEEAELELAS